MTDNRCPKCNRVVQGREEISAAKPKVPASQCKYCKTPLKLAFNVDPPLDCYYYVEAQ